MRRIMCLVLLAALVASPVLADKFDDLVEFIRADNYTAFQRFYDRQFNDPDERNDAGDTALLWVSGFASPRYIEYMISRGADINAVRVTDENSAWAAENALETAAWGGNAELLRWLLDNGVRRDFAPGAMTWAAKEANVEEGRMLVPYVDDLDMMNDTRTYIGLATNWGEPGAAEFVRMMIESGADVNAGPNREYQIMHHAAANENPDLGLYLMTLDVDWGRVDHHGSPAIMHAVENSLPFTKALLEKGVNLDVHSGWSGLSPLHEAVWQNNAFLLQLLLDAGAPTASRVEPNGVGTEEYANATPLELARRLGHRDLVRILQGVERVSVPDIDLEMEVELGMSLHFVRSSSDYLLTDYNGDDSRISDYAGSVVVHNLWASWCGPCVWEMPSLQNIQDGFRSEGLVVVAEAMYDERENSLTFIRDYDLDFDFYFRPEGATEDRRSGALPSTHIYSKSGLFLGSWQGSREWDTPQMMDYFEVITGLSY